MSWANSCVIGFVKVPNINGNLRLAESLDIQRRHSRSINRDAHFLVGKIIYWKSNDKDHWVFEFVRLSIMRWN